MNIPTNKRKSKISKHRIAERDEIIIDQEGFELFVIGVYDNSVSAEYIKFKGERTVIKHVNYMIC